MGIWSHSNSTYIVMIDEVIYLDRNSSAASVRKLLKQSKNFTIRKDPCSTPIAIKIIIESLPTSIENVELNIYFCSVSCWTKLLQYLYKTCMPQIGIEKNLLDVVKISSAQNNYNNFKEFKIIYYSKLWLFTKYALNRKRNVLKLLQPHVNVYEFSAFA